MLFGESSPRCVGAPAGVDALLRDAPHLWRRWEGRRKPLSHIPATAARAKPPGWRGVHRIAPSPLICAAVIDRCRHTHTHTPRRYPCPQTAKWNLSDRPPWHNHCFDYSDKEWGETWRSHNYSYQMPPVERNGRNGDKSYVSRSLLWGSAAHFIWSELWNIFNMHFIL